MITLLFSLISCESQPSDTAAYLKIAEDDKSLSFDSQGAERVVTIDTNSDIAVQETNNNMLWCRAKYDDAAKQLSIVVDPNKEIDARTTIITLSTEGISEKIAVTQLGTGKGVLVSDKILDIPAQGGKLSFEVTANIEYSVVISDNDSWLRDITPQTRSLDGGITIEYTYTVDINQDTARDATIMFNDAVKSTSLAEVKVKQESIGDYENSFNPDEIKSDFKIEVTGSKASATQSEDLSIKNSHDGIKNDINNRYQSPFSNTAPDYFPIDLTYDFESVDMDYIIYYPRCDGRINGNFKVVEVHIATKEQPTLTKLLTHDFNGSSNPAKVSLKGAPSGITQVMFRVLSGASATVGEEPGFAACSEMEFYTLNPDKYDPTAVLFTDQICSALKPGVTIEDIQACDVSFYRTIALYMFNNKYNTEFRVQSFKAWMDPVVENKTYKTSPYSLLDNPTGMITTAGEEFTVMVDDNIGTSNVSLRIFDLYDTGVDGYSQKEDHALKEGINTIVPLRSGLAYVIYHSKEPESLPSIKMHFATGDVNGYYDSKKHTQPGDWDRLLAAATNRHFDALGEFSHLTFPTESFREFTGSNGPQLIGYYDNVVRGEQNFMGMGPGLIRPYFGNRMYFHVGYHDMYMYATSYRTCYQLSTMSAILNPSTLYTNTGIWGVAHEVGHCNQVRPLFKWVGMTEVTNNMKSLYIQTEVIGGASRLSYKNHYQNAKDQLAVAGKTLAYNDYDIWGKLVALWQLYLYVTKAQGDEGFYPRLYEIFRVSNHPMWTPPGTTKSVINDGACQVELAKHACDAAQLDLTEFFEHWGFFEPVDKKVSDYADAHLRVTKEMADEVKSYIKNKNYPKPNPSHVIWDINDDNYNDYK